LIACLLFAGAAAFNHEVQRKTLAGLQGVRVVIEDLSPDAERDGLSKPTLQTDVELKLRQAGITVLTRETGNPAPGDPWLYLNVATVKRSTGLYAFNVYLKLNQDVRLTRAPSTMMSAVTWDALGTVGIVGSEPFSSTVRGVVKDQVDQFINAYLAANPKK